MAVEGRNWEVGGGGWEVGRYGLVTVRGDKPEMCFSRKSCNTN